MICPPTALPGHAGNSAINPYGGKPSRPHAHPPPSPSQTRAFAPLSPAHPPALPFPRTPITCAKSVENHPPQSSHNPRPMRPAAQFLHMLTPTSIIPPRIPQNSHNALRLHVLRHFSPQTHPSKIHAHTSTSNPLISTAGCPVVPLSSCPLTLFSFDSAAAAATISKHLLSSYVYLFSQPSNGDIVFSLSSGRSR